jgi:flagellar hook protein FlgE
VYGSNLASGSVILRPAGIGNAGTISSSSLEQSTADTSQELSDMVVAQQAYSASAKLITTVSSMYSALIQAIQ